LKDDKAIKGVIMAKVTLYERLGGYNAIAAVVDTMMPRLAGDQRLARFFAGHGEDSRRRLRQLQVNMICQATGGPCYYLGRDMKTVHKGLGIDGADWTAAISHLVGAMDAFKVADAEQKEVLSILNGIKKDILEKP
jgi:hemoglobin